VDDNTSNASMLVSALEPLGFRLATALGGREALDLALQHLPDLVLLDLMMPDVDGLEVARQLKMRPALARTRIIGTSATVSDTAQRNAFLDACDDFLPKPIQIDLLLVRIGTLLHIEWETASEHSAVPAQILGDRPLLFPPEHEMTQLRHLALRGDLRRIRVWADALEERDSQYAPFAARLRELSEGFQTRAILALFEQRQEGTP
jgi:CheY-like chemotaxis protein